MANEFAPNVQDADLTTADKALPNAGSGTEVTVSIDLGPGTKLAHAAELVIVAPALNTTELPDATTVKYSIEDSADDASFAAVATNVLTQTGAGGAGDAGLNGISEAGGRVGIPSSLRQFVRLSAVTSAGTGDASGGLMSLRVVV